jgi:hypothetical protein
MVLLQALEAAARDHHSGTGGREYRGEAAAESGGGARYQRHLTAELRRGDRKRKPVGRAHDRHHPRLDGLALPVVHTTNSLIALVCERDID